MRIVLDLEDRPFILKQLSKLYEELPKDIRSRKPLLPASELILEATEYISYLKSTKCVSRESDPESPTQVENIPKLLKDKFSVHYPLLYDGLKRLKTPDELKILSNLLKEPFPSSSKTPCYPLELHTDPRDPRAHLIVYRVFRDQGAEILSRTCNTLECINPHHYYEHINDIFIRTLSKRIVNKKDMGGSQVFLLVLLKKLSSREIKMLTKGFSGDRKDCFPVVSTSFPSKGEIYVRQLKEYVQHLLFKTFRFHQVDGELGLLSSEECSLSQGKHRDNLLCLNPWHFEFISYNSEMRSTYRHSKTKDHVCEPRLLVTISFSKFMCHLCWNEVASESAADTEVLNEASTCAIDVPTDVLDSGSNVYEIVKPSVVNVIPDSSQKKMIELQVPAVVIPDSSSESVAKPSDSSSDNISTKLPKGKMTPKANSSPVLRERSTRKRKIQAIFQCWKCLVKFTTNSELENHPCSSSFRYTEEEEEVDKSEEENSLRVKVEQVDHDYGVSPPPRKKSNEGENVQLGSEFPIKQEVIDEDEYEKCLFDDKALKPSLKEQEPPGHIRFTESDTTNTIYTCQFCGFCSSDISNLGFHTEKCKSLGLRPLPGLTQEGIASDSLEQGENQNENSSNTEETNSICAYCGVTFANPQELRFHSMKVKCRSIQCGVCSKFYATTRTHQHHVCEGLKFKESNGIIYFKVDNLNSSSWLVDCGDCGLTVPSRHVLTQHQSSKTIFCAKCKSDFPSVCKFISHHCLKNHFEDEFQLKMVSLKSGSPSAKKFINVTDLNKTIKCDTCGKMFINLNALEAHKSKSHN